MQCVCNTTLSVYIDATSWKNKQTASIKAGCDRSLFQSAQLKIACGRSVFIIWINTHFVSVSGARGFNNITCMSSCKQVFNCVQCNPAAFCLSCSSARFYFLKTKSATTSVLCICRPRDLLLTFCFYFSLHLLRKWYYNDWNFLSIFFLLCFF